MRMLVKLRRRFIFIMMGLVGLVLLVVLAVSVISSYTSESTRIERGLEFAIGRSPTEEQRPGVGRQDMEPRDQLEAIYIATVDLENSMILEDNSHFVYIDSTIAAEALDKIKAKVESLGQIDEQTLTGIFLNQGLFYRVVITADGGVTVAFADASALLTRTFQTLGISALIWIGAMILFFFISLWLSKIALRPTVEAWEKQRNFIADASHELKTPLTVILANNSLLLAHPEKTVVEQERWINSTQEEAQRMDKLVRDLLLLAQTDETADKDGILAGKNQKPEDQPTDLDLSALVNRNLLQFEAVFFERNITLQAEVAEGITLPGNEEQLNQLLSILLDNASKYAGSKGADAHVSVSLKASTAPKQHAVLEVANTGEAIDPEVLPHLFERFYRGDAAHSDTEGSGLGLSLAKAIVELHQGSISAASTSENGTIFTVVL
jgi:signal transduction histidine kinase